jgi:hypothetical protein
LCGTTRKEILLKGGLELVEEPDRPEVIEHNMAEVFTVCMAEQFHASKISVNL